MNYANMKIYFDGGHYVGIPQGAFPSGKGCKRRAVKPMKPTIDGRRNAARDPERTL